MLFTNYGLNAAEKPIRCLFVGCGITQEKKTKLEQREKPHGAVCFVLNDSMHQIDCDQEKNS